MDHPKPKVLTHRVTTQPASPFHELNTTPNVLRIRCGLPFAISCGAGRSGAGRSGELTVCAMRWLRRTDQLLEAAAQGDEAGVERWLQAGAEANAGSTSHDNWTGLHYAAQRGDVPVTEALLRHGADIDAITGRGRGCLHLAGQEGSQKHIAVIERLLTTGANADLQTPWGSTALHDAAYLGHVGVVKALLTHGACPHIEDQDGRNAWDVALVEREDGALDAIKEHVLAGLRARARLALASSSHPHLGRDSSMRLLHQDLIGMVVERIPDGMSRGGSARIYRYLKQTERQRVRALLAAAASTCDEDGGQASSAATNSGAGASLPPVPFTPLNERQLKRRRDSCLFTGTPPERNRHKN